MSEVSKNNAIYNVAPLTEKNFHAWKFRMQYILQDRGLWKCVEPLQSSSKSPKASSPTEEEEQKAMSQIVLTLSDEVSHFVRRAGVTTARDTWTLLSKQFEQKGLSSRVFLRRKLLNIKYAEGESMQAHLSRVSDLANQLESVGAGIKDDDLALIVLCSLPERFESFIVQMESRPIKEVTFDYVSGRLLAEASRQEESKESRMLLNVVNSHSAYSVRVKSSCSHCGRPGHSIDTCYDKYPELREKRRQVTAATAALTHSF